MTTTPRSSFRAETYAEMFVSCRFYFIVNNTLLPGVPSTKLQQCVAISSVYICKNV